MLHDGLIFGAGHYYPVEMRVQHEVEKAIFMYDYSKELTFDYINSLADLPYPYYVAIIEIKTAEVKAHGAFPDDTVGTKVSTSREGLTDLEYGDTFWLFVQNKNPMTGEVDQKHIWTKAHDGHYFSSGYYYHAERKAEFIVDQAINLYKTVGEEEAFATINALHSKNPTYPFVIDLENKVVAAHGAFPEDVGIPSVIIATDENIANLLADSATYTDYIFENPSSGQTEHKRTYLKLHDGYIFCSGFYYTVFGVTQVE